MLSSTEGRLPSGGELGGEAIPREAGETSGHRRRARCLECPRTFPSGWPAAAPVRQALAPCGGVTHAAAQWPCRSWGQPRKGRAPARALSRNHRLPRGPWAALSGSGGRGDRNRSAGVFFLGRNLLGTNTFPAATGERREPQCGPGPVWEPGQRWTQVLQGQWAARAGRKGSALPGEGPCLSVGAKGR